VIDHVTIRVSDPGESRPFYARALELLGFRAPAEGDGFVEWHDFSLAAAAPERPVTTGLHLAFGAESRAQVDAWWQALTDAGHRSDGAPGPRPEYGPEYYGGFVLDPDGGNSVEAVHNRPSREDGRVLDHLWIRVDDLAAARRFYDAVAPALGVEVRPLPQRVQVRRGAHAPTPTFSLVADGRPRTQDVHLAVAAPDRATVDAFHAAGVGAGFRSNGEPGERPRYHRGYYGAFLLDPAGNNVEAVFHDR